MPPNETKRCVVCGSSPVRAKGRCVACYFCLRRTGEDRPEELVVAKAVREFERAEKRRLAREATRVVARDEERRCARER